MTEFPELSAMPKPLPPRARCVLDDVLDRSDLSPTTRKQYEWVIGKWLKSAGYDPNAWTRFRAQRFYDQLIVDGVKPRTANTYIASLRLVSKWFALHHGGDDFAIVQMRSAPASPRRRALTPEEVQALLVTCDGASPIARRPIDRRDRTILIVGLETGMRRVSLVGMTIEGISQRGEYPIAKVPIKGKGGQATFEVPLSDTALLVLKDWIGWLRTHGVKEGPVFRSFSKRLDAKARIEYTLGGGISLVRINQLVEERAKKANIEHVHPHLLRNTFITWRQLAGLNGPQIASITGHHTFGAELGDKSWGQMSPYLDLKMLGSVARQATPSWFAALVHDLLNKGQS